AFGPADVADVDQAVEAVFDFDEGAEFGDVSNPAGYHGADRVLLGGQQPRIGLRLLDAGRDAAVPGVDCELQHLRLFSFPGTLRRVHGFLRPAHFADVHQTLDALFDLYENAVVNDADDLALVLAARQVFLSGVRPGVGN